MTKVYRLYAMGGEYSDAYEHTMGIFSSYDNAYKAAKRYAKKDMSEFKEEDGYKELFGRRYWASTTKHTGMFNDGETLVIIEGELDKE